MASCLVTGCSREPETTNVAVPRDAVARVGEAWITLADIEHAKDRFGGLPERQLLERVMMEESYAQAAANEGLAEESAVRAAIRGVLASRYLEKHLGPEREVSDDEVHQAWESSGDRFVEPASVHVAVVRQGFGPGEEEEARNRLQEVARAYREESDGLAMFGRLAAMHSDHQDTRYQGGDCGWIRAGQRHAVIPPDIVAMATAQSERGLLDEVAIVDQAAWLVLVNEVKKSQPKPFAQVSNLLRRELEALGREHDRISLETTVRATIAQAILHDFSQVAVASDSEEMPPLGP